MLNKEKLIQCLMNENVGIHVNDDLQISRAMPLHLANSDDALVWVKPETIHDNDNAKKIIAGLVICNEPSYNLISAKNKRLTNFVITKDPKRIFSILANFFLKNKSLSGIHPTAIIHSNTIIGKDVYVGPNTVIEEDCSIGDNTVIHGNCYLFADTAVGKNAIIHPCVVIGSEGFGYSRGEDGSIIKFPHIGGVTIMDNVEIGANTCIDRGALGNTIIHSNVKIDNLVHIAHNVIIHENAFIIANAMIGGSVEIGANAWIAPSAAIMQQLKIGAGATIGMGAVVTKNVPLNEVWAGNPARTMDEFLQIQKKLKNQVKENG
jgi:UDP-3-O-[3-hydroxymyristoyl] glucosamine N-acyltransferase